METRSQIDWKWKFGKSSNGQNWPCIGILYCVCSVGVEFFFRGGIQNFGYFRKCSRFLGPGSSCLPSWIFRISQGYPNFPLVLIYRDCRNRQKFGSSGVRKSSLLQIFRGIPVSPRLDSNLGQLLDSGVAKVFSAKFGWKRIGLGLGLGSEKKAKNLRFLEILDSEKNTSQDSQESRCLMVNQIFMVAVLFHLQSFEVFEVRVTNKSAQYSTF